MKNEELRMQNYKALRDLLRVSVALCQECIKGATQ